MVNYKPYEQNQLEALLSSGLAKADPTTAFQIFSGLQQGAVQRQAERQAMNQQMMQDAIAGLQSYATTPGVDPAGLDALVGSYQAMNPALAKPKFDQNLDQAVSSLQPLVGGGGAGGLTGEDASNIASSAQNAAQQGMDLHDARMAYMQVFRYSNPDPEAQQQAYDLFGQQFVAAGGEAGGVPVTSSAASAAPPSSGGGLETLVDRGPYGKALAVIDQLNAGGIPIGQASLPVGRGMGPALSSGLTDLTDSLLARIRLLNQGMVQ